MEAYDATVPMKTIICQFLRGGKRSFFSRTAATAIEEKTNEQEGKKKEERNTFPRTQKRSKEKNAKKGTKLKNPQLRGQKYLCITVPEQT